MYLQNTRNTSESTCNKFYFLINNVYEHTPVHCIHVDIRIREYRFRNEFYMFKM